LGRSGVPFSASQLNLENLQVGMKNFSPQQLKKEQAIVRLSKATRCRGAARSAVA
jgi:hypothetical protein